MLRMITASEGDAWMGLKYPRDEKAPIGSAGGGVRVKMRQVGRGEEVRTAKSNLPNLSQRRDE